LIFLILFIYLLIYLFYFIVLGKPNIFKNYINIAHLIKRNCLWIGVVEC